MAESLLSQSELAALRELDTCMVSNAIETFGVRLRSTGFANSGVRCFFEELPPMVEVIYDTHNRQDNVSVLPRVGITYSPHQPVTFYASWSQSFSPTLAAQFTPGGLPFLPEHGRQFEAGVRTSEFRGRLSSSLSFYRIRASNLLINNPRQSVGVDSNR